MLLLLLLTACMSGPAPVRSPALRVVPAPCVVQDVPVDLVCLVEEQAPPRPGSAVQVGTVRVERTVAEGVAHVEGDCWAVLSWPGEDCVGDVVGYVDELEAPIGACGCVGDEWLRW